MTKLYVEDSNLAACALRFKTLKHLEKHIRDCHTEEGIAKRQTERRLTEFLEKREIPFRRQSFLTLEHCAQIQTESSRRYVDLHLLGISGDLGAVVILKNDEYQHRNYACDNRRTIEIYHTLTVTKQVTDVTPLLMIRFNPHSYKHNGERYKPRNLQNTHVQLLEYIQKLTKPDLKHRGPITHKVYKNLYSIFINYNVENDELVCLRDDPSELWDANRLNTQIIRESLVDVHIFNN